MYYKADTNTQVIVERWILTGDGKLSPIGADGQIIRDAAGKPIEVSSVDALTDEQKALIRLYTTGVTDAPIWVDGEATAPTGGQYRIYNYDEYVNGTSGTALNLVGYTYLADGTTHTNINVGPGTTTTVRTSASGIVRNTKTVNNTYGVPGDGSMILRLFFYADNLDLTYNTGSTSSAQGSTINVTKPTYTEKHDSDDSFNLPTFATITREGYTLAGWSRVNEVTLADGRVVSVFDATGQTAFDVITSLNAMNATATTTFGDTGLYYFAQDGTTGALYLMPGVDTNLYAVWTPNLINYSVQIWKVEGDGDETHVTMTTETFQAYADTYVHADTDADGFIGTYDGTLSPVENGTTNLKAVSRVTTATDLNGYSYVPDGSSVATDAHAAVTTTASGLAKFDGSLALTLWYVPEGYQTGETHPTLTLVIGDAINTAWDNTDLGNSWSANNTHSQDVQDQIVLPGVNDVHRSGYTLLGWAWDDDAVSSTGTANRTAADVLAADTAGTWYGDGKHFVAAGGTYEMRWADATLYAVWKANNDTPYTIYHWRVTGDDNIKELVIETGTAQGTYVEPATVTMDGKTYNVAAVIYNANLRGITDDPYTAIAYGTGTTARDGSTYFTGYTSTDATVDTNDGAKTAHPTDNISGLNDTILTRFYDADTIQLFLNYGSGSNSSTWNTNRQVESTFQLPDNDTVTRDGYELVGWAALDATASGYTAAQGSTATGSASQTIADAFTGLLVGAVRDAASGGALYTLVSTFVGD